MTKSDHVTIKVPKLVYEDITPEAFIADCMTRCPSNPPKYALFTLVHRKGFAGREPIAMVTGVEVRAGGWFYHLIEPHAYDGDLTATTAGETDLHPFEPAKGGVQ